MHTPYSERVSLAIVMIVGCVALWMIVIAFGSMSHEIARLEYDVADLKAVTASHPRSLAVAHPDQVGKTQQYTNDLYGFSFQYPFGWYIKDELSQGKNLSISDDSSFNQGAPFIVAVQPANTAKELMKASGSETATSEKTIPLGSIDATRVSYQGDAGLTSEAYFIPISKDRVVVMWPPNLEGTRPIGNGAPVLDTFLKTFKAK